MLDRLNMEPLQVTIPQAARLLQISERQLYTMLAAGEIRKIKIGRLVRIPTSELRAWQERQLQDGQATR